MLSYFTVVFDASVLYPAPVRDLLIQLAASGLFRGKLTSQINREWVSNLLEKRSDLSAHQLHRTCDLIEQAMPDCMVEEYEPLIDSPTLPDADDRHVLAAAISCQAQAIITFNLRDFPRDILGRFGIEPLHPDAFLRSQADLCLPRFLVCVKAIRARLTKPYMSPTNYLIELASRDLVQTASFLDDYVGII